MFELDRYCKHERAYIITDICARGFSVVQRFSGVILNGVGCALRFSLLINMYRVDFATRCLVRFYNMQPHTKSLIISYDGK